MKMSYQIFVMVLLTGHVALGQQVDNGFPSLTGPYFGQKPPGSTPKLFSPGIVSGAQHEHSPLVFSLDGTEMYWITIPVDTTYKNPGGLPFKIYDQNIFFTTRAGGEWSKPDILPLTKMRTPNSLALSFKEDRLYYQILDTTLDSEAGHRRTTLYVSERDQGRWGNPKVAKNVIPQEEGGVCMTFCFAESGNLYFDYKTPDENGERIWKIFVRKYTDSGYTEPELLGETINSGRINWCVWVAPDESYLIWSSDREGDYGSGDLYISFRNQDGSWGNSRNMGNKVNTEYQERFPSVSPDGKYLFFIRQIDQTTYCDFYWVDAKVIEELRPEY